jgi:branched-subunit amino acid transport protein
MLTYSLKWRLPTYCVEKLDFSVLALFRQLVIESVNCQQDALQPIRANPGEANVVER